MGSAGAVGEHDRREAHGQPRPLADARAALDERHLAVRLRAGGNGHAIAHPHVARHARDHFVFDPCGLARHRRVDLQSDDRLRRDARDPRSAAAGTAGGASATRGSSIGAGIGGACFDRGRRRRGGGARAVRALARRAVSPGPCARSARGGSRAPPGAPAICLGRSGRHHPFRLLDHRSADLRRRGRRRVWPERVVTSAPAAPATRLAPTRIPMVVLVICISGTPFGPFSRARVVPGPVLADSAQDPAIGPVHVSCSPGRCPAVRGRAAAVSRRTCSPARGR